ncbi:ribonuclease HI [Nocardia arthritidis]|uniref:ribonuclease H n=1 Tax=Nocardia arthritidis TaxID=228602 RepID=A0A6G9YUM3_9NOCA|nr:ribonuclease HI [Nocardia arthritidis]
MIIVSTDGSCLRNPGGAIGWAWVNHQGATRSGGAPSGTNQIAELRAVLEAIVAHPGAEPMLIESDSLYAIKCASEWIASWRLNGWRTSAGAPVKNADLIKQIDRAISGRPGPVRFRWVRGHVGNYFNEQADTLAGEAARQAAADPAAIAPEAVGTPEPTAPELTSDLAMSELTATELTVSELAVSEFAAPKSAASKSAATQTTVSTSNGGAQPAARSRAAGKTVTQAQTLTLF